MRRREFVTIIAGAAAWAARDGRAAAHRDTASRRAPKSLWERCGGSAPGQSFPRGIEL